LPPEARGAGLGQILVILDEEYQSRTNQSRH